MKTVKTILGDVFITDLRMTRSHGYWRYQVLIYFTHEGKKQELTFHTNNSQLFDGYQTSQNKAIYLISKCDVEINNAITKYIYTL